MENQCGPQSALNPLHVVITHTPGASTATLNDGIATFGGTLTSDGGFAITPINATLGDGTPFAMTLTGKFGLTTLNLRQSVVETHPAGACRYVIDWVTAKVGSPNTIP